MPKLSIIIPAFNEQSTIARILQQVLDVPLPAWDKEIIVINDGSTDGTGTALTAFLSKIIYLENSTNQGKGTAIRLALERVSGDAVIIQDADLEYHPKELPAMISELEISGADIIYGSRNLKPRRRGYRHYVLGVWVLTKLINILYDARLTDVYTGYKLFRTSPLKHLDLSSSGFEIEAELTLKALKNGYQIIEVPIDYFPRSFAQGKKIGIWDWLIGIYTIFKDYLH